MIKAAGVGARVGGAVLAAAVTLSGCGGHTGDSGGDAHPDGASAHTGGSSTAASGPHNEADVAFAQQMIPHHAQAIDMSDIVLSKQGVDPAVTGLAEKIQAAQGPEIETMRSWLTAWGQPVPDTAGGTDHSMHHGDGTAAGMMSAEDLQALENASGADASRLFLEQMIEHHEGAVAMAREELTSGSNPAAKSLARQIVESQEAEIAQMRELLAG